MARRDPLIRNHQQGWSWRLALVVGTKEVHGDIIQKEPGWYNKGRGSKFVATRSVNRWKNKQPTSHVYKFITRRYRGKTQTDSTWDQHISPLEWRKHKKTILSTRPVSGTTTTKKENCHQMGVQSTLFVSFTCACAPKTGESFAGIRHFILILYAATYISYIPQWPNEPIHASCCSQLPVLAMGWFVGHRSSYQTPKIIPKWFVGPLVSPPPGLGKLRAGGGSRIMGGNQVTHLSVRHTFYVLKSFKDLCEFSNEPLKRGCLIF